jgi:hypothetical protein
MEPLAAVYRVISNGKVMYGSAWIKDSKSAVGKVRSQLHKGEILSAIWSVRWREKDAPYHLLFGDTNDANIAGGPEQDVAESLRKIHLKSERPQKENKWNRRRNSKEMAAAVAKAALQRISDKKETQAPDTTSTVIGAYKPPFTVEIA